MHSWPFVPSHPFLSPLCSYVFLRYHRYLYERLSAARKQCVEVATRKLTNPARGAGPMAAMPGAAGAADVSLSDVSGAAQV